MMPSSSPSPWISSRTIAAVLVASLAFFVAMSLPSNGWAPGNVIDVEDTPAFFESLGSVVGGEAQLYAPRGTPRGMVHAGFFAVSIAAMVAAYMIVLRRAWTVVETSPRDVRRLLALTAAAALPLVLAPFMLSSDVYSYIVYGRIYSVHESNPYTTPPYLVEDEFQGWLFWHEATLIYGPVWLYLSAGLTWTLDRLGAGIGFHVLAFKLLALGFHLASGRLVWAITMRLRPARTTVATAAYLLNPLCLVELAGNAHNDAVLVFLVLAAIWAHVRGRPRTALLMLALAALTKSYALMFLGVYGLAYLRESPTFVSAAARLVVASALTALVFIVAYAPVWDGAETFRAFSRDAAVNRFLNSPAELLSAFGLPRSTVRVSMLLAFTATALVLVVLASSTARAVRSFPWLCIAFCTLASTWFWPWYATFAVATAVAAGSRRAAAVALTLSVCAPVVYVTFNLGTPTAALAAAVELFHQGRSLVIFVPPLAVLAWMARRSSGRTLAA